MLIYRVILYKMGTYLRSPVYVLSMNRIIRVLYWKWSVVKVRYIMKVELSFHSVRMFIFSSYRIDPLLYYGSSFVDCGYSLEAYRYNGS